MHAVTCAILGRDPEPKMVSTRAKGVKRILWNSKSLHVGQTERGAYQRALADATARCATLNGEG